MFPGLFLRLRARVVLSLLASAAVSFCFTPLVKALAEKLGALDMPGELRRVNDRPVPRLGGLAIFIGFLVGVLPFSNLTEPVQGILLGCVIILLLGFLDDLFSLNPWIKLLVQGLAAFVAMESGVRIEFLTNPGWFQNESISLGVLTLPITFLWIVGITNALNLIDGLDGLAAGVSGIGCASMLAVSLFFPEATDVSVMLSSLGGACLGFLPYNRNPAHLFMGDSGAMLLGYILATASVLGLFKMYAIVSFVVPILALALPLSDTLFALVRRLSHGKNPLLPDRGHIHHRLLAIGLTQKQAVVLLYGVSVILGLAAVILTADRQTRFWLLIAAFLVAIGVWLYLFIGLRPHGKKPEESPSSSDNEGR